MTTTALLQVIPQGVDYIRILPELILSAVGIVVMLLDPLVDEEKSQKLLGFIALGGTVAGLFATLYMAQSPGLAFSNMVKVDSFSVFFHFLVIAIAAVVILSSFEYMAVQRIRAGEYYALILFGVVGMALMSSAVELVLIFIALEISSISTYILTGFRRNEASSSESSLKYFLLGSFATAFFLYGVAMMFGATGSTNIGIISQTLQSGPVGLLVYVAMALMFVGLGFKVAAAPFHIWTPDVYEGAPAPIVGFMSTAPKAAAFAVLLRVVFTINAPGRFWLLWVAAGLSMTLGNVGALVQNEYQTPAGIFFHRSRRILAGGVCDDGGGQFRRRNIRCDVLHRFLRGDECGRIRGGQPLCLCRRALCNAGRLSKDWDDLLLCWRRRSQSSCFR